MHLYEKAKCAFIDPVFTQSAVRNFSVVWNSLLPNSVQTVRVKKCIKRTKLYLHKQVKYGLHCANFHEARKSLNNVAWEVSMLNFTKNVQEIWNLRYNGRYRAVLHENHACFKNP